MAANGGAILQRSVTSFRRQGSSGLVWDERFLTGELTLIDVRKVVKEEEEEEDDKLVTRGRTHLRRQSHSDGSVRVMMMMKSTGTPTTNSPVGESVNKPLTVVVSSSKTPRCWLRRIFRRSTSAPSNSHNKSTFKSSPMNSNNNSNL